MHVRMSLNGAQGACACRPCGKHRTEIAGSFSLVFQRGTGNRLRMDSKYEGDSVQSFIFPTTVHAHYSSSLFGEGSGTEGVTCR